MAAGSRSTAASSAALSSPGAPASTRAASSSAARANAAVERREVLAALDRAEGEHEGPAVEVGEPWVGQVRRRLVDGEWTEVDDLDVAGTEEFTDGGRRGVARRVHRGAALHTPPQHLAGPPHVRRCLRRVGEEPAVVHRHERRPPARRHDVVGAVDDLGVAEPPIDPRMIQARPHPYRRGGGQGESPGGWLRRGPEAEEVGEQLDAGVIAEGGDELGDGDTDPGPSAVQRADVDGETNRVHAGWPP